jgi:FG-GAP-like repeat
VRAVWRICEALVVGDLSDFSYNLHHMRRPFLVAATILALAGPVRNQTGPEWVRHVIVEGFPTQTAVAADFAGNGRMDVITGDITPNHERTILYVAPDWRPIVLYTGIRTIHSAAIDVDGEGRLDFVGSRYHPGLIYWLERPKDSLHETWPYHVVDDAAQGGVDGVHGLWAGDVDRDGKIDLVASSGQPKGRFPDSLVWFRIPPNPRAAARWDRYVLADRDAPGLSHYIGFGDVNGDGRSDVASAAKDSEGGNWFAWWEQGKDPRKPWKKHLIAENQFGATNILMADLNGDGRVDFVGSRGHGTGITWYEAPQWKPHEISSDIKGPHSLAIGDINGDGYPDVVTVAKDSRFAAWFENDGKGNFKQHLIGENQSAYDIRLVDMDGDGDLDILVAGFESNNVVWYENRVVSVKRAKRIHRP